MATTFESGAFRKEPTRRSEPADHTVFSEPEDFLFVVVNDVIKFHRLPLPVARVSRAQVVIADGDDGAAGKIDVILTNGTTTHTLISQSTVIQAGGQINTDASGVNLDAWYMKALRGTPAAPWYLAVKMQTTPGTPKGAAYNVQAGLTYQNDVKD